MGLERMYGNSVFSFLSVWALSNAEGDWIFVLVFIFESEHFLLLTVGKAVKWTSVCSAGHRILYSVLGRKQDTFCLCWLPSLPHLLGAQRAALHVDCTSNLSEFYWWGSFWNVFRPAKSGSLALLVRSGYFPRVLCWKVSLLALCALFVLLLSEAGGGGCVNERWILEFSSLLLCPDLAHCTALAKIVIVFFLNYQLCFEPCSKGQLVYKWFVPFINFLRIWKNFALGPEKWNTCIFYCVRWHIGGSDAV